MPNENYPDESRKEPCSNSDYIQGFNKGHMLVLVAAELLDITVPNQSFVPSKEQWDTWWNYPGKGFSLGMQLAMANLISGRYVVLDRGEQK